MLHWKSKINYLISFIIIINISSSIQISNRVIRLYLKILENFMRLIF